MPPKLFKNRAVRTDCVTLVTEISFNLTKPNFLDMLKTVGCERLTLFCPI